MLQNLLDYLETRGYMRIASNVKGLDPLVSVQAGSVNIVLIYKDVFFSVVKDGGEFVKKKIKEQFSAYGEVHIMVVIIGYQTREIREICAKDPFCWVIDESDRRLCIYENQISDFYGLRGEIEQFLERTEQIRTEDLMNRVDKSMRSLNRHLPAVTISLVIINIIVFLICTGIGDKVYNIGMLHGPSVLEKNEYYRMFTSMFLHSGMEHLASNMLILYFLGEMIEKKFGHVRYLILYFIAGLGAGAVSIGYEYYSGQFNGSVGASGAIFGLIGALLFLVIYHRGRFGTVTLPRILFMIAYSIYSGFRGTNIDNAAHIGGLLTGFVAAALLYLTIRKVKRKR